MRKLVRQLPSGVESVERYIQIRPVNFRIFDPTSVSGSIGPITATRCAPAAARAPGASLPAAWAVVYEKVAEWIAIEA